MLVLITYDVNTADAAGRKRLLRQIARQCVSFTASGFQSFPIFECQLGGQYKLLQAGCAQCGSSQDGLRFYSLGNRYEQKIEHFGA